MIQKRAPCAHYDDTPVQVRVYSAKKSPQCTYLLEISHVGEDAYALQSFAQTHFVRQDACAQQWNTSGGSFDELPASCDIERPATCIFPNISHHERDIQPSDTKIKTRRHNQQFRTPTNQSTTRAEKVPSCNTRNEHHRHRRAGYKIPGTKERHPNPTTPLPTKQQNSRGFSCRTYRALGHHRKSLKTIPAGAHRWSPAPAS